MLGRDEDERAQASTAWSWLTAGNLDFGLEIYVDQLAVFMMLIVTGVGALIVGYSIGYMDKVDEERRFFAYMAFFVFSMLLLVEGGNLLMLLAAWGLVGLSSYLLIGFEHERPAAIAAAKKAFIMNAVGDATFALALFLLIQQTGVLGYEAVFAEVDGLSSTTATLVALGLLGGAVAKSAQLPLQTWLPDAMEGPTPVSALIHAATMVVAGVYLIFRTAPVFEAAPEVQDTAAILGALTLVAAGLIALVQTDIKRVIAYSTMSQIGYMFLAVGIGAYATGMFHLLTHAFFKALLFLAAGDPHPRAGRGAGPAADGRPQAADAVHVCRFPRRRARARRRAAVLGLLLEGPDPRERARRGRSRLRAVRTRRGGRAPHRPLHVPDDLPRVRRRAERGAEGALPPARREGRAAVDGARRRRADGAVRHRRLPPVRARTGRPSTTSSSRSRSRSSTRRTARRRSRASSPSRSVWPASRSRGSSTRGSASTRRGRGRRSRRSSTSTISTTRSSTGRPPRRRSCSTRSSKGRSSAGR